MIRLMLLHGFSMVEFLLSRMALEEFSEGACRQAVVHLLEQFDSGRIDQKAFLDGDYGNELRDLTASLLVQRHEVSKNWVWKSIPVPTADEDPYKIAEDAFKKHRKALTARSIREIRDRQRFVQDEAEHLELQKRLIELIKYMKELDPEGSIMGDLMNSERAR